ncbi:MAG: hypothetical protein KDI68_16960 [Gammaproteobacteria bacterium]|nr:hypothetical protein [Gammaproteobacteria bacterium]
MSHKKTGWIGVAVAVMGLAFSGASQSEDCDIGPIGMSALSPAESTRLGGLLMSGLRGKYEVSVVYLGSRQTRRGRPLECKPVKYRVDTYYDAGKGAIGVVAGEVQTLDPWSVGRTAVSNVRLANVVASGGDVLSGADIVGFSLNVGPTRPGCAVIGSGNYLPEGGDGSVMPMPFALMPNYSRSAGNLACGQR